MKTKYDEESETWEVQIPITGRDEFMALWFNKHGHIQLESWQGEVLQEWKVPTDVSPEQQRLVALEKARSFFSELAIELAINIQKTRGSSYVRQVKQSK